LIINAFYSSIDFINLNFLRNLATIRPNSKIHDVSRKEKKNKKNTKWGENVVRSEMLTFTSTFLTAQHFQPDQKFYMIEYFN